MKCLWRYLPRTTQLLANQGFEFDFVDTRSLEKVELSIKPNTKWIFAETPTNPLLGV